MSCPAYPSVAAATISWSNTTAVQYTCITGYSMEGDSLLSCTAGAWATTPPRCLIVYENHDVLNSVNVYQEILPTEIPDWLLYLMAGSAGLGGLSFLVGLLLCCLHLLGCYSGPVVGFGGNHVYPKKQCCNCAYCCCCCCRFCKRCCTGPDDDDDDEDDEEQIGLPMLEKEKKDVPTIEQNGEPPGAEDAGNRKGKGTKKGDAADGPVVDKKNPFPLAAAGRKKNAEM